MRSYHVIQILLSLTVYQRAEAQHGCPEIPFAIHDGFIWIEVTVGSCQQPLHFLLDSGAQVSVIDTAAAQRLGLQRGRQVTVEGVDATKTGFWPQVIEARAAGVPLVRNYLMLDLQSLSAACTNGAVDGLIGADFFKDRIVQIDYEMKVVRLLPKAPEAAAQAVPLRVRGCGMLVPIRVNNTATQWVRLDTGCAAALRWVTAWIHPEECTSRIAVGLTPQSVAVTQTALTLGTARFEDVPTDVQQQEIFPGEKGLLGNGLLSRFGTVTIDACAKTMFLGATRPKAAQ